VKQHLALVNLAKMKISNMKKIRTALLAYGMSGKVFHAPFLSIHERFELTGAWERSKKLIQQDFPLLKSYASLEELLNDDVELVVVNTPVHTHFEYAQKALLAGKHILVEKAFTTNAAEAATLAELATQKDLQLTVFQNRRWDSDFKTVKKVLDDGLLGQIVEAEIRFDRYNPALSSKLWKEATNAGAGILMDLGPHIIDQAICLFGYPKALFADSRRLRKNSMVDDNIDILLMYDDKRVRLHAGFFNRELLPAFVLQGRNGSFFKDRGDVQEDVLKTGKSPVGPQWGEENPQLQGILHTEVNGKIIRNRMPTLQGNYTELFDGVYKAIRDQKPEPVSAYDGLLVMKIIDAVIKSNESGKIIPLS